MAKISENKLGVSYVMPVVAMMPEGAQIHPNQGGLHLRLMGASYIRVGLMGTVPPAKVKAIIGAIAGQPDEPSYSGSMNLWKRLDVVPASDGRTCDLMAGTVKVLSVYIDPTADIISTDESIQSQVEAGDGDGEDEDEDADTVN